MTKPSYTLFISDLHIDVSTSKINKTFLNFLETIAINADSLYILGDFFEYYIGDDSNPIITEMAQALNKLTNSGVPVYFMHGNRDFLIGENFAKNANIILLQDPTCINLYGKKILLTHGDYLCSLDKSHQRFRKITNNSLIQKIFIALPLTVRKKIADSLRNESMMHNRSKPLNIMDVTQEAVIKFMQRYNVNTLIHGHTHRCATHNFKLNNQDATRIVLDAWHNHGHYLKISENGEIENIFLQL